VEEMTIGERIKRVRIKQGIKQRELARKAGVSSAFMSQVENGQRDFAVSKIIKVAITLNVSIDYLLGVNCINPIGQVEKIPYSRIVHGKVYYLVITREDFQGYLQWCGKYCLQDNSGFCYQRHGKTIEELAERLLSSIQGKK
jgi:transcriptional regulator with XRE-family HTH domain